jgi:hypothetical protein
MKNGIFTAVSPDDAESNEPYLVLPNLAGEIYCPIIYVPEGDVFPKVSVSDDTEAQSKLLKPPET